MTAVATPTTGTGLAEAVRAKLQAASGAAEAGGGRQGTSQAEGDEAGSTQGAGPGHLLEEEVRLGAAFSQPSGKNGEVRYWSRDERQHLRDKAIESAATPQAMSAFKTKLGKEVKGVDGGLPRRTGQGTDQRRTALRIPRQDEERRPALRGHATPPPRSAQDGGEQARHRVSANCWRRRACQWKTCFEALRNGLGHEKPQPAKAASPTRRPSRARKDAEIQSPVCASRRTPPRSRT